jgi:hypothetical protein
MNTRTLLQTAVTIMASSLLAGAALAGPGPQFWHRPAPKPAPAKMDEHPTGKCEGCKTTPIWVVSERAPAGKGIPRARITGSSHACTGCSGKNTMENGQARPDMQHAAGCAKLVCCK